MVVCSYWVCVVCLTLWDAHDSSGIHCSFRHNTTDFPTDICTGRIWKVEFWWQHLPNMIYIHKIWFVCWGIVFIPKCSRNVGVCAWFTVGRERNNTFVHQWTRTGKTLVFIEILVKIYHIPANTPHVMTTPCTGGGHYDWCCMFGTFYPVKIYVPPLKL